MEPGAPENKKEISEETQSRNDFAGEASRCLLDLYVFADAHKTRRLRNDIITAMHLLSEDSDTYMGLGDVPQAFDNSPDTSTMCQYVVASVAYHWDQTTHGSQMSSLALVFILLLL
jgi:hypothetical protein